MYNQYEPDGDFPTLSFPNPEEGAEVLKMALKTADENDSAVVIANDPDADRMGLAEKGGDGSWRIFTGMCVFECETRIALNLIPETLLFLRCAQPLRLRFEIEA